MRPERLYLAEIVEAARAILAFLSGRDRSGFLKDDFLQSAVLMKLIVIGEAAAQLPEEFRVRHPEVPWSRVVGFRNIAVHQYFGLNLEIVWTAATHDAPELAKQIGAILAAEFPESSK